MKAIPYYARAEVELRIRRMSRTIGWPSAERAQDCFTKLTDKMRAACRTTVAVHRSHNLSLE
jgi:hypothetical protein